MVRAMLLSLLVLFSVFLSLNAGEEEAFDVRQHLSSVSRYQNSCISLNYRHVRFVSKLHFELGRLVLILIFLITI